MTDAELRDIEEEAEAAPHGYGAGSFCEIEAPKLIAEVRALKGTLRSLEWVCLEDSYGQGAGPPTCPSCERLETAGHASDCALAAALGLPTVPK